MSRWHLLLTAVLGVSIVLTLHVMSAPLWVIVTLSIVIPMIALWGLQKDEGDFDGS